MTAVEIIALQDVGRKQAQLAGGAAAFALKAGFRKTGLGGADGGDFLATGLDLVGDRLEKGRAFLAARIAI